MRHLLVQADHFIEDGRDLAVDAGKILRQADRKIAAAKAPQRAQQLAAVEGLDVTVLYASTVRPFDAATLRATLGTPDVVLVEPYLAGTSAAAASAALVAVPHRLLALGTARGEVRRYGTPEEHDALHGLDAGGIRRSLERFLRESSRADLATRS